MLLFAYTSLSGFQLSGRSFVIRHSISWLHRISQDVESPRRPLLWVLRLLRRRLSSLHKGLHSSGSIFHANPCVWVRSFWALGRLLENLEDGHSCQMPSWVCFDITNLHIMLSFASHRWGLAGKTLLGPILPLPVWSSSRLSLRGFPP